MSQHLELFEFPFAPHRLEHHAVRRRLAAPAAARPGLEFVLGDALAAPFADGAFDAVLTPWLVDIVPDDLTALMARLNRLLSPGGRWIYFGSLAWADRPPERCYSLEELLALAPAAGFENGSPREASIPYMCSPASRHARLETVISFAATKQAEVARPAPLARPDWLERTDLPVPALAAFREQSLSTRGPVGSVQDGKLYPFKYKTAEQPMTSGSKQLIALDTKVFFATADPAAAVRQGLINMGIGESTPWEWVQTDTFQMLNHQVSPSEQALQCANCHGTTSRMDLKGQLGYQLKAAQSTVCTQCHGTKDPKPFEVIHDKHVRDKQYDCSWCHTLSRPEKGLSMP